jgi:hypothetical protein
MVRVEGVGRAETLLVAVGVCVREVDEAGVAGPVYVLGVAHVGDVAAERVGVARRRMQVAQRLRLTCA